MTYFPHSEQDIKIMLEKIGKKDLEELTKPIPDKFKIGKLDLDNGKTEVEIVSLFSQLGSKNREYKSIFLGAGAYNHFIPSVIDEIVSRQEFYTAYTPYQAEVSQGTLRAIFEYQTYIATLTSMDASNASLYDGATSLCEAVIMAINHTRKNKILIDRFVHPEYLKVLKTYMDPIGVEIVIFENNPFNFDIEKFKEIWKEDFACFVVSSPNFFGTIYDFSKVAEIVHNDKSLLIQSITEILSLTILKPPGKLGVDIVCGEAQSLGIPLSFGGPYLGFISCKKDLIRKLPGRLIGQTKDKENNIVYVLTLTAREQHIRRELASSNICSNHGLCALRASIYLSILGKTGLKTCGLKNIENTRYLYENINKLKRFKVIEGQTFFNEFVVKTDIDYNRLKIHLEKNDILSFYPLGKEFKDFDNHYLIAATENNTKEEIDNFIKVLKELD